MPFDDPTRAAGQARAPDPIDVHVGCRLRLLRRERGISQEQLSASLGLTFQQVQKYERGVNRISASKMHAAATFLKVPLAALFTGLPDIDAAPETAEDRALRLAILDPAVRRLVHAYQAAPSDRAKLNLIDAAELYAGMRTAS